ncbi:MAG: hypothetical protein HC869_19175, partial [Rhodospirillales bacterium]|nr:hypothetical protein [Rhodospirillales bacterium]
CAKVFLLPTLSKNLKLRGFRCAKVFVIPVQVADQPGASGIALPKCFLSSRRSCSGKISSEHYISASILDSIKGKFVNTVMVSGFNFGLTQFREVGIRNLTTKVLCERHNALLSPFDAEMSRFVKAIQSTLTAVSNDEYYFSGHDIERWMLKSSIAMLKGRLLKAKLPHGMRDFHRLSEFVLLPVIGNKSGGLYFEKLVGDKLVIDKLEIRVETIYNTSDGYLRGLRFYICGLPFLYTFTSNAIPDWYIEKFNLILRPYLFEFRSDTRAVSIFLDWHGSVQHKHIVISN